MTVNVLVLFLLVMLSQSESNLFNDSQKMSVPFDSQWKYLWKDYMKRSVALHTLTSVCTCGGESNACAVAHRILAWRDMVAMVTKEKKK